MHLSLEQIVPKSLYRQMRRCVRLIDLPSRLVTSGQIPYHQMLQARDGNVPRDFSSLSSPGQKGLVSIILPVYNGQRYLSEAIDSVIAQTYTVWELVIVDDGSSDNTSTIIEAYAGRDSRIRGLHQENKKLPEALNTGHKHARGEFITWTSDDNRLKPDFLEILVAELQNRPNVDMVYADIEAIDENGAPYPDAPYYRGYQYSKNPGEILLPRHVSMLHIWNCVGSAFLYRRRVLSIIGDYSTGRFTCEDYDFFLRVNEQMNLRHSRHRGSVYQYRVHGSSLTAQSNPRDIPQKMAAVQVFDDKRWDIISGPIAWHVETCGSAGCESVADALRRKVHEAGHVSVDASDSMRGWILPRTFVWLTDSPEDNGVMIPVEVNAAVLVVLADSPLPATLKQPWTLCIYAGPSTSRLPLLPDYAGWLATPDLETIRNAVQGHTTSRFLKKMEEVAENPPQPALEVSVLLCTNREPAFVKRVVDSLCVQTLDRTRYEIILINNDPDSRDYSGITGPTDALDSRLPGFIEVPCRPPGLSHARNAGLASAHGKIVVYLDDDAIADPDLLERLQAAFENHPEAAVIGGTIELSPPDPMPRWYGNNLGRFWSEFLPRQSEFYLADSWLEYPFGANWSARRNVLLRIGGFRSQYGPGGRFVDRGDETVAALCAAKLGCSIGIEPGAKVLHRVDQKRFSLSLLFHMCRESFAIRKQFAYERRIPPGIRRQTNFFRRMVRFVKSGPGDRKGLPYRIEQLAIVFGLAHSIRLSVVSLFRHMLKRPAESLLK